MAHVNHQPVVGKGDYVLVKFAKKQRVSYYAGKVMRIDKREDEVQTTYLKHNDMHKSNTVTLSWQQIEDLAWYDGQDIITKLPGHGRQTGFWVLLCALRKHDVLVRSC